MEDKNIKKDPALAKLEQELAQATESITLTPEEYAKIASSIKGGISEAKLKEFGFTDEDITKAKALIEKEKPEQPVVVTDAKPEDAKAYTPDNKIFEQFIAQIEKRTAARKEMANNHETLLKLKEHLKTLEEQKASAQGLGTVRAELEVEPAVNNVNNIENKPVENGASELQKEYDALWDKLKSIKPWQVWKIGSFIKARIEFGSVEKKLKKERYQEEMDSKYGHMSLEELDREYIRLRDMIEKSRLWEPEVYIPLKKEKKVIEKMYRGLKANTVKDKFEVDPTASEYIQNMQKLQNNYYKNDRAMQNNSKLISKMGEGEQKEKAKENNDLFRLENIHIIQAFEEEGRKAFPMAYYAVDKIQNPNLDGAFTGYGLRVEEGVDRPYTSLQVFNAIYHSYLEDPIEIPEIGPNDYQRGLEGSNNCVNYNIYGFSMRIVDVDSVTFDSNGHFEPSDANIRYTVTDPSGKILIENVDYNNAEQIYTQATEEYAEKLKEEFNNSHKQ